MLKKILTAITLTMCMLCTVYSHNTDCLTDRYGGTLVWGICHHPTLINPLFTTHSVSMALLELLFNGLVRIDARGEIEPDLAERWDISDSGRIYTFYLRKGVRFHDGIECTAEDVKYTYDLLCDETVASPFKPVLELIENTRAKERYVFEVALKEASPDFISRFTKEILPRHILENTDIRSSSFNFHPVGTGPFCFVNWNSRDEIELRYNPDYHEGRPYLDTIMIRPYAAAGEIWSALMRGEVDFCGFIEQRNYEIIRNDPAFTTYSFPVDGFYGLVYDLKDDTLSDIKVRQAIARGLDIDELIRRVSSGYGKQCHGPFYQEGIGADQEKKPDAYDPLSARQLLAQAGWNDTNNDQILEKEGRQLELRVLVDKRDELYKKMIMVIRQQLQVLGIKVRAVFYVDDKELEMKCAGPEKPNAHLTILMAGLKACQAAAYWDSRYSQRSCRVWLYKNQKVDALFKKAETCQDPARARDIYKQIHALICEEQPVCFLYFPFNFHAVSARIGNTDSFFSLNMPEYTMKDWYLKE